MSNATRKLLRLSSGVGYRRQPQRWQIELADPDRVIGPYGADDKNRRRKIAGRRISQAPCLPATIEQRGIAEIDEVGVALQPH
jgi:hypothetical protein